MVDQKENRVTLKALPHPTPSSLRQCKTDSLLPTSPKLTLDMSLPTPPGTSHRDKENRVPAGSRVSWAQQIQYRNISRVPQPTSPSKPRLPGKSILKKPAEDVLLPLIEVQTRQDTPEPQIPMVDAKYLEYPVSTIVAEDASLASLITAYSILTARLRNCAGDGADPATDWPLFEPLRTHRDSFANAIVRHLTMALTDPLQEEKSKVLGALPTPKKSPKKKRCMSEEQVKYARDLCTITLAVIRLLAVILASAPIFKIFTTQQLRDILSQVLSIPLAPELPTLNSRKTCALAIWLIQVQRLPSEVLLPSSSRIAYAIRRGIEGELGKEGKKGAISDGLRAIHDLLVFQPVTFVPAFSTIFDSILETLLAASLNIRTLACHAIGGFVLACTSSSLSDAHVHIATKICEFTKRIGDSSPSKKSSPNPIAESPIVRTLRTTLNVTESTHIASGPVWGLCVLGSFICLAAPVIMDDARISKILLSLLSLAARSKSSTVRGLGSIVWRCATWTCLQNLPDEAGISTEKELVKDWWNFLSQGALELGTGTGIIAALVGDEPLPPRNIGRVFDVLRHMTRRNRQCFGDAQVALQQLISVDGKHDFWESKALLPVSFFAAHPGLLTTDLTDSSLLLQTVRSILCECPESPSIRPLSKEELLDENTFDNLVQIWKDGFGRWLRSDSVVAHVACFVQIIQTYESVCCDWSPESDSPVEYGVSLILGLLQDITSDLQNALLDNSPSKSSTADESAVASKLKIIRRLWLALCEEIPNGGGVSNPGLPLVAYLMRNESELTESSKSEVYQWTLLCAELLATMDLDAMQAFWGCEVYANVPKWRWEWDAERRNLVWTHFADAWLRQHKMHWECLLILLSVPFVAETTWEMSSDDSAAWEKLLKHGINIALDYGVDAMTFVDHVAEQISRKECIRTSFVVDTLLEQVEIPEARQVPESLLRYANDVLKDNYPPDPQQKTPSLWMIRTLTNTIDKCPKELLGTLLETIQEGVSIWIFDESGVLPGEEYNDILSLCETMIMSMSELPKTAETVRTFGTLLEAVFCQRPDKPASAFDNLVDFWNIMFSQSVPPEEWPAGVQTYFGVDVLDTDEDCISEPGSSTSRVLTPRPITPPRRSPPSARSPLSPWQSIPSSPLNDIAIGYIPSSPSANKRRRIEKENIAPPHTALKGPVSVVTVKRRSSSPEHMVDRPLKRTKTMHSASSTEGSQLLSTVIPLAETAPTPRSSRRKRLFLKAVEVPTVEQVYGKVAAKTAATTRSNAKRKLEPEWDSCHLAWSTQQTTIRTTRSGRPTRSPLARGSLRRSGSLPSVLVGSDDSIMTRPTGVVVEASSDDDPYDGQVTPHHLISPALVKHFDDPPSDDSDVASSPSREVVKRRLARTGSMEPKYSLLA